MTVENLLQEGELPPLNALRAFDAAGRHLSFSRAAEELGVTQGAVAQHVRALEARFGTTLFERQPRGLVFTETGRAYHGQVARAFRLLREASAQIAPQPARVTISVTPTFASRWLIPRLSRFTETEAGIDLRILATERVSSFHSDGIDIAVRQGQPPFGASLRAERLFAHDVIAVCAPQLCAADAGWAALGQLMLLHDAHNLWPEFLRDAGHPSPGGPGKTGLRFNQTSLGIEAALSGQGVALASRFLVARDLAAGRLVQPVHHCLRAERDFYLLAPRSKTASGPVQAVWNWLCAERDQA
ncbi:LysR substrate-binding domain-containing protein [Roseovarius sp. ZX-A-9]|uniref:LysR substrate-binding domain-containing protein n=1 Tax=Roseovarius sp. ZX-A-9 TaxID=3014783 RepID=UPI00232AEDB0|nr:LysR substrate-binding domain-containing protein [Roseovarius sp. ZX-A-9]